MTEYQHDQLVIERLRYTAHVRLNGTEGCWEWEVPPVAPPEASESVFDEDTKRLYYRMPDQEHWIMVEFARKQLTSNQLLMLLAPEEASLLMGYCQHVSDQLGTHVGFLLAAMGDALAEKRWSAMRDLNAELAESLGAQQVAGDTARMAYEASDRQVV